MEPTFSFLECDGCEPLGVWEVRGTETRTTKRELMKRNKRRQLAELGLEPRVKCIHGNKSSAVAPTLLGLRWVICATLKFQWLLINNRRSLIAREVRLGEEGDEEICGGTTLARDRRRPLPPQEYRMDVSGWRTRWRTNRRRDREGPPLK